MITASAVCATGILFIYSMGQILQNWRVYIAAIFSTVLVIGSFMLARGIQSPPIAQASAETALLQAIATKDSDGDGLPNWEEALYGTDSNFTDTFNLGMTDGEAVARGLIVPKAIADIKVATSTKATNSDVNYAADGLTPPTENTLTDAFAKNFLTLYLAAKQANGGADLSDTDTQNIENQALASLSTSVTAAPDFKSVHDLKVSGSGVDALKAFAVDVEAIFKKNASNATTSELIYLQYVVTNNDATALTHLTSIAKAYRDSAAGLAALPVPTELVADDLALVNAMMRMSGVINDFARVNTDPLATMLALEQYVPAVQSLGEAFTNIGNAYAAEGITLPRGTPGASFINIISDMTARQQTAIKTL